MPTKPENRDYKAEYARESEARKEQRRMRMRARYAVEKERGKLPSDVHVDHKKPLSKGGSNSKSNLRVVKAKTNLRFKRQGPGGKPK